MVGKFLADTATENPRVGGSIPPLGTNHSSYSVLEGPIKPRKPIYKANLYVNSVLGRPLTSEDYAGKNVGIFVF